MVGWHHQISGHEFELTPGDSEEEAMAPTLVLLPGKSQGRRSLVGCSPWGG